MLPATAPTLRLTRRGRLVASATAVVLLLLVGGWVAGRSSPDGPAPPQGTAGDPAAISPTVQPRIPRIAAADAAPEDAPAGGAGSDPAGGAESGAGSDPAAAAGAASNTTVPVAESEVAQAGTGRLVAVPGTRSETDQAGRLVSYRVLIEEGLTVAGGPVDGALLAETVHGILTAPQGWQGLDGVRFRGVDGPQADVDVVIAAPNTVDRLCAPLGTGGQLSCFNGSAAVLNARRWFAGAATYGQDLVAYRTYLVSHEVGHYLGHQHQDCPGQGLPAPVMVQQTKSLDACLANPWPSPAG